MTYNQFEYATEVVLFESYVSTVNSKLDLKDDRDLEEGSPSNHYHVYTIGEKDIFFVGEDSVTGVIQLL